MAMVVWRLREFMEEHGLSPRVVEKAAEIGENTIYRVLRGDGAMLVDRRTLAAIIAGLRKLTGKDINVSDLLNYDPDAAAPAFERRYAKSDRTQVSVELYDSKGNKIDVESNPDAGIDVSAEVVVRRIAPLPELPQRSGRTNREKK